MRARQVYVVVTEDKPGTPHVVGVFVTYDEAKAAKDFVLHLQEREAERPKLSYCIWEQPFHRITPPFAPANA